MKTRLPERFIDEVRSRASLADVAGRKVTWDPKKSNPGKGDMWAPCPFHQEKTPSFHVDDRKGFYYCFGCHAKGDVIGFVRETENVGYLEAVKILARDVGLKVPEPTPEAKREADRFEQLVAANEEAVRFFKLKLRAAAGADARDYLAGRGLSEDAIERWEIGFAPDSWEALRDHLASKGIAHDLAVAAGLLKKSDKGRKPYDTFRDRITFPIRDHSGRAVAFGGRAMDPSNPAKYLNSPETEVFDKGRTLFNLRNARSALGKGTPLIVAEGYMDVIALSEAGFATAVAPLGTAITESQLELMWRMEPEPVIALDGDEAGVRAAMRLVDLGLPSLDANRSFRFAMMPEGQDPDDLLKRGGPPAMRRAIEGARSVIDLIWRQATEGKTFDSPERLAALDKALKSKVSRIQDADLRKQYTYALGDLQWKLRRGSRGSGRGKDAKEVAATASAANSQLAAAAGGTKAGTDAVAMQQRLVLATVLATPEVVGEYEERLANLVTKDPELDRIRDEILTYASRHRDGNAHYARGWSAEDGAAAEGEPASLHAWIAREIGEEPLRRLTSDSHLALTRAVRNPGDVDAARMTLDEELGKLESLDSLHSEVDEAREECARRGLTDEDAVRSQARLRSGTERRDRTWQKVLEEKDVHVFDANGRPIVKAEQDELDALIARSAGADSGDRAGARA